jgi:hypothetical protein
MWLWLERGAGEPSAQTSPRLSDHAAPDQAKNPGKKHRRRASSGGLAASAGDDDEGAAPLSAADLRTVAQGDAIRPRPVEVDLAAGGEGPRALGSAEINDGVQARHAGLEQCLVAARQEDSIHARITVTAVVDPDGRVNAVRVEAPAILQRRGLSGCMKSQFKAMHFAATGRDNVITVPFSLD